MISDVCNDQGQCLGVIKWQPQIQREELLDPSPLLLSTVDGDHGKGGIALLSVWLAAEYPDDPR